MTEPVGIAASIVGIVVPALHGTRLLLEDLQQLKDAPETVQHLEDDLRTTLTAIASLEAVEEREWKALGTNIAEESKAILGIYKGTCDILRADVQRWTRHSKEGKLAWQDRASVGFFKHGRIKSMSEKIQSYKTTINSIVSVANLYSSIRHGQVTEEIKGMITTRQTDIQGAISTTDNRVAALESRLGEVALDVDRQKQAEGTADEQDVARQLEDDRKELDAMRKLLGELMSKSQEDAVTQAAVANQDQSTTITFGNQNSGFQTSVINGSVSRISFGGR